MMKYNIHKQIEEIGNSLAYPLITKEERDHAFWREMTMHGEKVEDFERPIRKADDRSLYSADTKQQLEYYRIEFHNNLMIDKIFKRENKLGKGTSERIELEDSYEYHKLYQLYGGIRAGITEQLWFDNVEYIEEYLDETKAFCFKYEEVLKNKGFELGYYEDEYQTISISWNIQRILFYEYLQIKGCLVDIFVDCYLRKNGRWKYWKEKMRKDTGPFRNWKTGKEPMYLGAWRDYSITYGDKETLEERNESIRSSAEAETGIMAQEVIDSEQEILEFYKKHKI